ncbi:unnamed protein product [Diplocarpon coronariae]|uniref:dihydroneopterin aldolase n=1 Tax=Diplocarpon coronariae TaxID=2795749 RepID=A0A218ZGA9_9HELO|nr:hypothetical protein B2J93_7791 [Marssonina coronariae]
MPPPLLTPHALTNLTGEPHSLIRVTNLSTILPVGTDAWGRRNIPQPILLSASISLRHPFTSASSTDTVAPSTVHYGSLSKAILAACKEFAELCADEVCPVPMHLRALVQYVHFSLTRQDTLPKFPHQGCVSRSNASDVQKEAEAEPLLKCESMRLFELEVTLPKASLLGDGISLKGSFGYEEGKDGPNAYSMVLRLRGLRIPTLVGVNACERLAKQMVYVDVEMQRWDWMVDGYRELEELVVKSTEESSFQTLEALAEHLVNRIIRYTLIPHLTSAHLAPTTSPSKPLNYPRIKISLSKPTAVTFADAPTVEMIADSDPCVNQLANRAWEEFGRDGVRRVPFPLQGRLDNWIEKGREESAKKRE